MSKKKEQKQRIDESIKNKKESISPEIEIIEKIINPLKGQSNHHKTLSIGQKAADSIAKWAGSWVFILTFMGFLGLWILTNIYGWLNQWDPYPFILLNLVLSCLAAFQAPIILMSQNRSAQRDRQRAEYDYIVNRKAEKEIKTVIEQLDRIEKKLSK